MSVGTYKYFEFFLGLHGEIWKKSDSRYVGGDWKYFIVINLSLHPVHQVLDIFGGWQCRWLFIFVTVSPKVFVSIKETLIMKYATKYFNANLEPPLIFGQVVSVQYSETVP